MSGTDLGVWLCGMWSPLHNILCALEECTLERVNQLQGLLFWHWHVNNSVLYNSTVPVFDSMQRWLSLIRHMWTIIKLWVILRINVVGWTIAMAHFLHILKHSSTWSLLSLFFLFLNMHAHLPWPHIWMQNDSGLARCSDTTLQTSHYHWSSTPDQPVLHWCSPQVPVCAAHVLNSE